MDTFAHAASRLISSSKVSGTVVFDPSGKKLGHIDDVMIDKVSGQVAYAVLAFGGFLGINDHHHPLPWASLRYDPSMDGYVVDIDARTLTGAPSIPVEQRQAWPETGWGQVDDYYGVRPAEAGMPLDATLPAR